MKKVVKYGLIFLVGYGIGRAVEIIEDGFVIYKAVNGDKEATQLVSRLYSLGEHLDGK